MTDTPLDLDALTALEQRATAAPWTARARGHGLTIDSLPDLVLGWEIDGPEPAYKGRFASAQDAHLIASLRNQAPSLIAATRERDALRALLADIYPTIAGRVIQLDDAGETGASSHWDQIARRIYAALEAQS